ncbi:hypothetical protein KFL_001220090 [Klebsormidium nitens]|uniref:Uncharacterized protein n=1 Tax=Klebsormidium nitens TaxID=105231 RepID=A0A1Y1I0R8_KLENI|nr:hypothetical protein KFL_001220090 [Klebsormidium nitens]|eukprot:GAQ82741.1 hypothetical protein KFL_001220090 [Klebsormidium nitens]
MASSRPTRGVSLFALSAALYVFVALILPSLAAAQISAAAPAAANATVALQTPVNVADACTKEVFHSLTYHYRSCSRKFFHYEDPDEDCCQGLAHFYGPESPMPSRNCFCDETYAAWFSAFEDRTYYPMASAFKVCKKFNITIGYFDDGEGPCAGKEYSADDIEATCIDCYTSAPHASLGNWLSRLDEDWGIAMSFAIFWVSLFGCVLLVGSVTLDFAKDAQRLVSRKKT